MYSDEVTTVRLRAYSASSSRASPAEFSMKAEPAITWRLTRGASIPHLLKPVVDGALLGEAQVSRQLPHRGGGVGTDERGHGAQGVVSHVETPFRGWLSPSQPRICKYCTTLPWPGSTHRVKC